MKNILICLQENVINSEFVQTVNTPHLKIWFWIAFLELIIIAFLILKFKKNKRDLAFGDISKQKIKNKKKSVDLVIQTYLLIQINRILQKKYFKIFRIMKEIINN